MHIDPFNLDQTAFARTLRVMQEGIYAEDLPDEPPHPLHADSAVARLCEELSQFKEQLFKTRQPNGAMNDDAYFAFDEGLVLRPEIVVKVVLDYVRQHPEML